MPNTERNIRYAAGELSDWLKRKGQPRTTEQEVKHQGRKFKKNFDNKMEDIAHKTPEDFIHFLGNVGDQAIAFVDDLVTSTVEGDPTEKEKLAKECDKETKKLVRVIDDCLADGDLPKQVTPALQSLKVKLEKVISKISKFLSNLFGAKKEAVEEKHKGYTPQQKKGHKGYQPDLNKAMREKYKRDDPTKHKGPIRQHTRGRGNKN